MTTDESDIDDCEKDDTHTFHSDGKYHLEDGDLSCDPAESDTDEGTWALAADNKTLTLTSGGFGLAGQITELTGSKLVIRFELEDSGVTFLDELTFGR